MEADASFHRSTSEFAPPGNVQLTPLICTVGRVGTWLDGTVGESAATAGTMAGTSLPPSPNAPESRARARAREALRARYYCTA